MVRADIMQGHVLERLRELPDGSVDLMITSPPYWGLRDYGLPPLVWPAVEYAPMAGLPPVRIPGDMDCQHEWGKENIMPCGNAPSAKSKLNHGVGSHQGQKYDTSKAAVSSQGQFCRKCGAWRGSLGLEPTIEMFVGHLVLIFREVRRVMARHAVCFVNLGDSYWSDTLKRKTPVEAMWGNRPASDLTGGRNSINQNNRRGGLGQRPNDKIKPKDLCGVPWRVALALQADGWWLRSDIIWAKPSCMPESVNDRPTRSHEYVFLLAKSAKYHWDAEAVKQEAIYEEKRNGRVGAYQNRAIYSKGDGTTPTAEALRDLSSRNIRTVWSIPSAPMSCGLCAKCGKYWHGGAPQTHCVQQTVGHFAAFPPKLVEPMIKAGTSEKGYCPKCGKPWERVVEKGELLGKDRGGHYKNRQEIATNNKQKHFGPTHKPGMFWENKTLGWQPTCSCGLEPRPGTVLDIFGGAMTTAMVAAKLGRCSISCEINPDYVCMGRNRLRAELGMLCQVEEK